jgi:signal recognition particle subunit SRP54
MFDKLTEKVSDALRFVAGKSAITEKNIDDAVEAIKMALLEADVNLRVVRRFVNATVGGKGGKGPALRRSGPAVCQDRP